jgi:hypothetical protein
MEKHKISILSSCIAESLVPCWHTYLFLYDHFLFRTPLMYTGILKSVSVYTRSEIEYALYASKREKLFYPSSRQFIGNTYRSDFYTISINYSMRMRTMHIQFQSVYTHLHFSICQYTLEVSWIRSDHIKKDKIMSNMHAFLAAV